MQGKVVLVTGGAGGIGVAICRIFAEQGARVLVGYRSNRDKAEDVVASLDGDGHRALFTPVTSSADLKTAAEEVDGLYGHLDCLVNNAGITRFVPHDDLDGLDDELIDRIFQTNWRGAFACTRAFTPLLEKGGNGVIINISSIAGVTGMGSNVAYCASKAAIDSMTRSLARALAPRIRVLSVSPGVVDTEFIKGLDQDWREEQIRRTPVGRFVSPEEVAEAVLVAVRDLTVTTGVAIPVDGGRPLM